jgi:probable HAF family extracellular repeat protein
MSGPEEGSMGTSAARRCLGIVAALVVAVGGLAIGVPPAGAALGAELIELGSLGGPYGGEASVISGDIVAGTAWAADGTMHAFAYDLGAPSAAMIDLGTLGGTYAAPMAIDGDIVVGYADVGDNPRHAWMADLGDPSPAVVDLGTLGGLNSLASDVEGTVIVGEADGPPFDHPQAFMYDLAADTPQMVALGSVGGTSSGAVGVDGGVITGVAYTSDWRTHVFTYDLNDTDPTMVDRGTIGTRDAYSYAIDDGVVAAAVTSKPPDDYSTHAAFLDLHADTPALTDIGTLGGPLAAATRVDGGVLAGSSHFDQTAEYHAFVYDTRSPDPHMTDLGTLGGSTSNAYGIDGRFVVGTSRTASSSAEQPFAYDLTTSTMRALPADFAGAAMAVDGGYAVGHVRGTNGIPRPVAWRLYDLVDTTTAVQTSGTPLLVGSQVTYTATVSPAPDGGTVAFRSSGDAITGCSSRAVDPVTGTATCTTTLSNVGTTSITATYSGNQTHAGSGSASLTQQTTYGVKVLTNHSRPQRNRRPITVELQLVDALGQNVSSPNVDVAVLGVAPNPAPGVQPTGTFEDVVIKRKPAYRDTIDVARYPNGTYTFSFAASSDPVTHSLTFTLR